MKQISPLVLAVFLGLFSMACGAGATPTRMPASTPQQTPAASIVNADIANFAHQNLTVKVGAKVVWTNKDGTGHTVTEKTGKFKSGVLGAGQTFTQTFNDAGNFEYVCEIHSTMKATVTVTK